MEIFSIITFFKNLFLGIWSFFQHRAQLSIEIKDHVKRLDHIVQFFVYLQNNSASSILISEISILHNGKKYPCELESKRIRSVNGVVTRATINFPINLSPESGLYCYLEFLNCQDIEVAPEKKIVLEAHTNRGDLRKSLILSPTRKYLHLH